MNQHSILIVDDEPNILRALKRTLRKQEYKIFLAGSAHEGINVMEENDIHLVISDQMMPKIKGTEFLGWVKQKKPQTVRILLTAYTELQHAIDAINKAGVFRFISKPWVNEELILTVERALEHYDMLHDLNSLMAVFQNRRGILNKLPLVPDEETGSDSFYVDAGEYDEFDPDDLVEKYWQSNSGSSPDTPSPDTPSPAPSSQTPPKIEPKKKASRTRYSILVVDDDPYILDVLEKILAGEKFQIFRAQDAYQGLEIMEKEYIHLIISDQMMPGMSGTDLLKQTNRKYPYAMRVLITAFATLRDLMEAINTAEIYHFIPKPFRVEEVSQTVSRALDYYELRQDLKTLIIMFQNQQEILKKLPEALRDNQKGNIHYINDREMDDNSLDELIQKYWDEDSHRFRDPHRR